MSYAWSKFCAWMLTISMASLAVFGVLALFANVDVETAGRLRLLSVMAFAAAAAFALFSANNASAAAMHALSQTPVNRATLIPSVAVAAVLCLISVVGVHIGWTLLKAGAPASVLAELPETWIIDVCGLFLAFAKPSLTWIIQGRVEMDKATALAAAAAEEANLKAIRDENRAAGNGGARNAAPAQPAAAPKKRPEYLRVVAEDQADEPQRPGFLEKITAGLAGGSIAASTASAAAAELPRQPHLPAMEAAIHSEVLFESREAAALKLIREDGVCCRNELVRRVPNMSKHLAAKLLDEHVPGWRTNRSLRIA